MASINRTVSRQSKQTRITIHRKSPEKIEQEMGIETIHFTHISAKFPVVSSMEFCVFELLKSALSKCLSTTLCGLCCSRGMDQNTSSDTTKGIIVMKVMM
ncbi:hypothetical protein AVEN_259891-1 [Araneus ventricosus]|uniref:Uncharacterized protein n=1 Tax=Araneus ventricosus TaxID=182803 RepID=A0A4Y2J961_ARAVE|nr:hypothetical protein AVEN_259891-1 [Araneus ventricosus]